MFFLNNWSSSLYHAPFITLIALKLALPESNINVPKNNITFPTFLWIVLAWHSFLQPLLPNYLPFIFKVNFLLDNIWVFFFFCSLSFSVSVLFRPFTFKVIINSRIYIYCCNCIYFICFLYIVFFFSFYFHIFYLLLFGKTLYYSPSPLSICYILLLKILSDCLWVLNMCNRNLLQLYSYLMRIPIIGTYDSVFPVLLSICLYDYHLFLLICNYQFSSV